ncbi:MAG: coiled-coil domain-containing protein [Planctomycetota bacterium]|jgi:hypothetical protein
MNRNAMWVAGVAAILGLAAVLPTAAQNPGRWVDQLLQPELLRRDLRLISEQLELDEAQRSIVEALLRDYEKSFEAEADKMRQRMSELRPRDEQSEQQRERRREIGARFREIFTAMREAREQGGDPEMLRKLEAEAAELRERMGELRPPMPEGEDLQRLRESIDRLSREWRGDRRRLRGDFMSGVQAVLTEEQLRRWDEFERTLRRLKSLPRSRLSGESVDMLALLRDLGIARNATVDLEMLMDDYARELDAALVRRDEHLEESRTATILAMLERDMQAATAVARHDGAVRAAIVEVNEQYAGTIPTLLDEQQAATFSRRYRERAFPRIFEPTTTKRAFAAALEMELEEEVRAAVEALRYEHARDLDSANERLLRITRADEPRRAERQIQRWLGRMIGQERSRSDDDDPIDEAYRSRRQMEDRYRDQLESLLPPEEAAQLPAPADDTRQRWQRGAWGGQRPEGQRPSPARTGTPSLQQRRADMRKEFDRNGDGVLDEQEREAARRALRERQSQGGGDGGS